MRAPLVAFVVLFPALLAPATVRAASVAGEAYGALLATPLGPQLAKTPVVELDPTAKQRSADAPKVDLATLLRTGPLSVQTKGAFGAASSSAQSRASVHAIDVLDSTIRADLVLAISDSVADGSRARSRASGSTILGLKLNGAPVAGDLAPNTRVELPGTGYVVFNEQLMSGDGVTSSGLEVNMIHVFYTNALGFKTGEIVVGSARSSASLVPGDGVR